MIHELLLVHKAFSSSLLDPPQTLGDSNCPSVCTFLRASISVAQETSPSCTLARGKSSHSDWLGDCSFLVLLLPISHYILSADMLV